MNKNVITSPSFYCDCAQPDENFPHFWEHTVGSGHATLGLRADWQEQLRRCRTELGFRHVRFHGILCDDMSTFLIENDQPLYSFTNIDRIFDFLLSIGIKPFVELSFMPSGLSSGSKTAFHYRANVMPPRDYAQWALLIKKLVLHWIDRYSIDEVRQWFFEVWNEPNLEAFGTGRQEDYFKLYRATANALKAVDSNLKVGGPATAMNAWISDFINFCEAENLPVDFISTHHYPTDAFGKPGDDTETQLSESKRSALRDQAAQVKTEAGTLPVYYTEWSSSSNPRDALHDEPYAAAFLIKTIMEARGLVEGYSWWTFSDIFEENYFPSIPFHGGFGLLNIHGIAKPAYRAFQILHGLGNRWLKMTGSHETVDTWIIAGDSEITILLTNFALPRHPLKTETVNLTLENLSRPNQATIRRIDSDHANPKRQWQEMGAPEYPDPAQIKTLCAASETRAEEQPFHFENNRLSLSVTMPPLGIAAIRLECDRKF